MRGTRGGTERPRFFFLPDTAYTSTLNKGRPRARHARRPPRPERRCSEDPDGPHPHHRRHAAQRHDPDLGSQERGPAADDREPSDRGDAGAHQRAAAGRHRGADADSRQSRRRPHGRRQASGPDRRDRPDRPAHRLERHRYHSALRTRLDHAGELLGHRAVARPLRRGQGIAARRLRHRHPSGRPADHGTGKSSGPRSRSTAATSSPRPRTACAAPRSRFPPSRSAAPMSP